MHLEDVFFTFKYFKETMLTKEEILRNLNIERLTPMQEAALEAGSGDKDMILLSPTGSGKTLAYLLPLLGHLREGQDGVQAVVLVPSRELALQIESVFKSMGTPFRVMSCYGGRPAMEEHRAMNGIRPSVIVGTPGRMNDHLSKQNFDASTVGLLVIDEFDKCLELGFHDEMSTVIAQLPALRRRFLISATDAAEIPEFTGLHRASRLDFLEEHAPSAGRIKLYQVQSPSKDKLDALARLLCMLGTQSSIVFCNYRESVERISQYLTSRKIQNEMFHGGMEQPDRERALYKFRNGSCNVFVSTDLASRGLDIPEIDNIIHYHLPLNEEAYVHRNGRTARWEAKGCSFLLLHEEETLPEYIGEEPEEFLLDEHPSKPLPPLWVTLYIGKGKKDKINKVDIVGFLCKKGQLRQDEIGRIDVKDHYAYVAICRKKLSQTLNLIKSEKIKGLKTIIEETK